MEASSPVVAGDPKPKEDKIVEKSYLSGALESMSAWGVPSRSSTPKPVTAPGEGSGLKNQHGGDHNTQHYGISSKRYPSDCPPLNARWFYAVDVNQGRSMTSSIVFRLTFGTIGTETQTEDSKYHQGGREAGSSTSSSQEVCRFLYTRFEGYRNELPNLS